jgi:hypothetical protein
MFSVGFTFGGFYGTYGDYKNRTPPIFIFIFYFLFFIFLWRRRAPTAPGRGPRLPTPRWGSTGPAKRPPQKAPQKAPQKGPPALLTWAPECRLFAAPKRPGLPCGTRDEVTLKRLINSLKTTKTRVSFRWAGPLKCAGRATRRRQREPQFRSSFCPQRGAWRPRPRRRRDTRHRCRLWSAFAPGA